MRLFGLIACSRSSGLLIQAAAQGEKIDRLLPGEATAGDAESHFVVAQNCATRKGVKQNLAAQAADWYQKAAEQGHAQAQFRLGLLFHTGQALPQDEARTAAC
jgi:TPR repeat protein